MCVCVLFLFACVCPCVCLLMFCLCVIFRVLFVFVSGFGAVCFGLFVGVTLLDELPNKQTDRQTSKTKYTNKQHHKQQ